jgi:hypothetical protein
MPVVISNDFLFSPSAADPSITANNPRIGIQSLLSQETIFDTPTQNPAYPAYLVATPNTFERLKTVAADYHLFVADTTGLDVDYVGIAAHKGLIGRSVRIRYLSPEGGIGDIGEPFTVTNNDPIFVLFGDIEMTRIIIVFSSDSDFSFEIGNIYIGKSVALQRRIGVGHTPIGYGRDVDFFTEDSANGNFLDSVVGRVSLKNDVSHDYMTPQYYKDEIDQKFALPAQLGRPFFFAWRPKDNPKEVGFCRIQSNSFNVAYSRPNGMMRMSFSLRGFSSYGQF